MDAQDFRSLQEAYLKVVENNERNREKVEQKKTTHRKVQQNPLFFGGKKFGSLTGKMSKSPRNEKEVKEDLYDIILSHLLDEGYAETPEAAEVIMVNMSEEWREGIIEAYKPWDFGPKQKAKAKYTELLKTKQAEVSRGISGGRGTATRANKIGRVGTEMRKTLDKDTQETGADPKKQGLQPSTRRHTEAARRRASRGLPSASTARKSYG